jgi:hypothetical protein
LVARLQNLFQDFSEEEASGRTVGEVQPSTADRLARELIKAGGAAVAAAAVHPGRELQLWWRNSWAQVAAVESLAGVINSKSKEKEGFMMR